MSVAVAQENEPCVPVHGQKLLTLQDMPEEILEHILGFLSPYKEMDAAKLVSRQWNRVIKSVTRQLKRRFYQNLSKCEISWSDLTKNTPKGYFEKGHIGISDRFSHSAAYHDGSMYIFGGCTSTNTTFNDLWRFDLTTRQWVRPVAVGTYPSPKACATMVVYNGNLVLFGGWSHPIPYPLHQSAHYFSELHVYSPVTNRWSHILCLGQEPEALGGHSASVAGHLMVIFGGSPRPGLGTNNLWVFNFLKASWKLQPVCRDAKPEPRYGQFQTTLDEKHILIMGGCVGQNRVYNDLWLLTLHPSDPWQWTKLTIEHSELAAPQTWCHAACRVNNSIVVVARSSKVRQTHNIRKGHGLSNPSLSKKEPDKGGSERNNSDVNTSSLQQKSDTQQQEQPHNECQRGVFVHQGMKGEGTVALEAEQCAQSSSSLLALQKRLHRDCLNLPDSDNHHHNTHRTDPEETEGYYHRLNNKWGNEAIENQRRIAKQSFSPPEEQGCSKQLHKQVASPQNNDQPQFGSLQRVSSQHIHHGRGRGMPSIRPNATCNRQKQLEALQRQEELLRSKSRALAAARVPVSPETQSSLSVEENVPELVTTRNNMDVHVLDISRVLGDGVAEWQTLSELQPTEAPLETICCSLLEGRGELILFGGVVRNMDNSVITNTAVNKLYLMQPK